MSSLRIVAALALAAGGFAASPASAQFYLKSHDMAGQSVTGDEADIGFKMPGATPAELRAGLLWNMRAGLNVAALQCQFEPTLLVVSNYNAMLKDHDGEFDAAQAVLNKYYLRTAKVKTKKAGSDAFDQFGTHIYSSFSTVSAQRNFCQTANVIGRDAIFTPRGGLTALAQARMREMRNSLVPYGEQGVPSYVYARTYNLPVPRLDAVCWSKKGEWQDRKCGAQNWPPAAGIAAR